MNGDADKLNLAARVVVAEAAVQALMGSLPPEQQAAIVAAVPVAIKALMDGLRTGANAAEKIAIDKIEAAALRLATPAPPVAKT